MFHARRFSNPLVCFLFVLCFITFSFSTTLGAGEIDPTFNGSIMANGVGNGRATALQPDGKLIVAGSFTTANGVARSAVARFNADGTLDTSFNVVELTNQNNLTGHVLAIGLQSSGKIYIGGNFLTVNNFSRKAIARLNPDGTLDQSFNPTIVHPNNGGDPLVEDLKVSADDKLLICGLFKVTVPTERQDLARFNADGTLDTTFLQSFQNINTFDILPDGKLIINSGVIILRLNSDGTQDSSFQMVTAPVGESPRVAVLKALSDGRILVGGGFRFLNSSPETGIGRINTDGSVDTAFNGNNSNINALGVVYDIEVSIDNKYYISGNFNQYHTQSRSDIARLNEDGTLDVGFSSPLEPSSGDDGVYDVLPLNNGQVIATGLITANPTVLSRVLRLNSNGSVDSTFNATINNTEVGSGAIIDILQQADGKILIGGNFQFVNGTPKSLIARLHPDGTLDNTFQLSITANHVLALAQQPDGKILIGGQFPGTLIRVNLNGSPDLTFNQSVNQGFVHSLDLQSNGSIIAAGQICQGSDCRSIARILPNGLIDTSFTSPVFAFPNFTSPHFVAKALSDGKIIVGGNFTSVGGLIRGRIVRLNSDGSLDTTFNPPGGANNTVVDLAIQPDGKIIIGGNFTGVNGVNQHYVARLNTDGSLDTSFVGNTNGSVQAVTLQPDGKVLIGGLFTTINNIPRNRLTRLNSDGSLDNKFYIGSGASSHVMDIALQTDGKILAGGFFNRFNDESRVGLVRLLNTDTPRGVLFDYDGDAKADVSLFRPANNFWYRLNSGNGQFVAQQFGQMSDIITPADFDGDSRTDLAFFRPASGLDSAFHIINSSTGTIRTIIFGSQGDVPLPSDWDGDERADLAVYREGTAGGQSCFFYRPSSQPGIFITVPWGKQGDKPVIGDFDGDGKTDAAVFRPSTGGWHILQSSNNQFYAVQFGAAEDKPTAADFDGDGKTDIAVFRPSNGAWYRLNSTNNQFVGMQFGTTGDIPVAADYDGDGKADVSVFRPLNGVWYLMRSTQGFTAVQFGQGDDLPTPAAYNR